MANSERLYDEQTRLYEKARLAAVEPRLIHIHYILKQYTLALLC